MFNKYLMQRIWEGFKHSPQEELKAMISEFKNDYASDTKFINDLPLVEQAIEKDEYDEAANIMQGIVPGRFSAIDWDLFLRILNEAKWTLR